MFSHCLLLKDSAKAGAKAQSINWTDGTLDLGNGFDDGTSNSVVRKKKWEEQEDTLN